MSQFGPTFDSSAGFSLSPGSMDIAFWVEPSMLAGESSFVRHLMMGLKAEGQEITFIAPHNLSLAELPVLGSRVLSYRWNRWEKLPVLQKLRLNGVARQLNDQPPDVLLAWGSADFAAMSTLTAIAPALPVILWCWDASELFSPMARLPSVRHIIAASEAIASRIPENFGIPVTVVHPGVFCEDTIACFDVAGQIPCLVSLDPLSNPSAYESLLKACRMLADGGHEYLVFAYDKGSAEYAIWRQVEQLKLLDRVNFVPFQQEAEILMLHGDLYIHIVPTSRVQYRSLEAMGRGLCIVTCPNHSADYLLENQTCRIVGPQTPEAWCNVLLELLQDRDKATAIARRGQQLIRERHSMARTLEQLGSICRQAAGMAIPLAPR